MGRPLQSGGPLWSIIKCWSDQNSIFGSYLDNLDVFSARGDPIEDLIKRFLKIHFLMVHPCFGVISSVAKKTCIRMFHGNCKYTLNMLLKWKYNASRMLSKLYKCCEIKLMINKSSDCYIHLLWKSLQWQYTVNP